MFIVARLRAHNILSHRYAPTILLDSMISFDNKDFYSVWRHDWMDNLSYDLIIQYDTLQDRD